VPLTGGSLVQPDQMNRAGQLSGRIYVEGGRTVGATAIAALPYDRPGGTVFVSVIVHGYLEPAINPAPPTCG
jgi:hypothetical protein